jgi:UDP-glucose 4-epimerase
MRALVTGGAGFIGSHIVDRLLADGAEAVTVVDNFSTGKRENLAQWSQDPRLRIVEADTRELPALVEAMQGSATVFHFQAHADVRGGMATPRIDLEQNTLPTWNVLEAMRQAGAKTFVFASSATVYGEPERFPTPEDEPLVQTSLYGASKLAGEALAQAYAEYYGMRALAFRFVSCTGPRYWHGVVADFCTKLRATPDRLEVLGDGTQRKSFLDVRDAVRGIFAALHADTGRKGVFNLGHHEIIEVRALAEVVRRRAGCPQARLVFSEGPRGWLGDSPLVHLDTARIRALGWVPQIGLVESLEATVDDWLATKQAPSENRSRRN